MTDISAYFEMTLSRDPWAERLDEVAEIANADLAQRIERRLRQEVDLGLDKNMAAKAQAIRVKAEGDRLIVDSRSQDEVLGSAATKEEKTGSLEDLFTMGSGVPETNAHGDLVYRRVKLDAAFKGLQDEQRSKEVERLADSTMQLHINDIVGRAITEVERRHLGEK